MGNCIPAKKVSSQKLGEHLPLLLLFLQLGTFCSDFFSAFLPSNTLQLPWMDVNG